RGEAAGFSYVTERERVDSKFTAGNRIVPQFAHAFLWHKGSAKDLGRPAGFKSSFATSISDNGVVAAYCVRSIEDQTTQGALWRNGRWTLLSTPPGMNSRANGVNSRGDAVGYVGDFREKVS